MKKKPTSKPLTDKAGEVRVMNAADFVGAKVVRRGRPPKLEPKVAIHFRVDPRVLEFFKALGPGYQTRMNDVLMEHVRAIRSSASKKRPIA